MERKHAPSGECRISAVAHSSVWAIQQEHKTNNPTEERLEMYMSRVIIKTKPVDSAVLY